MASLTDKLRDLGVQVGTSQIESQERKKPDTNLLDALPGSWESTTGGDCFVVRKEIPISDQHGALPLTLPTSLDLYESMQSLEGITGLSPAEFLFIDTETTGLSGGAGTYVFLIGAARVQRETVQFAQFFLQDPGLEGAQLSALETFTASTKAIISYNGKSFDLPRIRTRFSLHGWPDPFENVLHLDLLHIARRIWKDHFESCNLGEMESQLLGVKRDEIDIPGWKVSETFYEYLQDGNPAPLQSVFYHNEVDVLSLITLFQYITDRLNHPLSKMYRGQPDLISIGSVLAALGQTEKAAQVYRAALKDAGLPDALRLKGQLGLASLHKQKKRFINAVPLWQAAAESGSIDAAIELAKYYEHQTLDFYEAIHWTLQARELASQHPAQSQAGSIAAIDHRLNRLKRKSPGSCDPGDSHSGTSS